MVEAERQRREHDVLPGREAAHQVGLLEDEAEGAPAHLGQEALRQAGELPVAQEDAARGGAGHGAEQREERGLAGAARPGEHGERPGLDGQAHPGHRLVLVRPALVVDAPDLPGLEERHERITASGSVEAARQTGTTVASV